MASSIQPGGPAAGPAPPNRVRDSEEERPHGVNVYASALTSVRITVDWVAGHDPWQHPEQLAQSQHALQR
ncbi:MAG: hypothetical protein AAB289_06330, partial [Chloroflexota bacterium]